MGRWRSTQATWRAAPRVAWSRVPAWRRYLLRESTALFVAGFALLLLASLIQLLRGNTTWKAWLGSLASAPALGFHALAFVAFAYHAWTWFAVMPKTLPAGRWPAHRITAVGLIAALLTSLSLVYAAFAAAAR